MSAEMEREQAIAYARLSTYADLARQSIDKGDMPTFMMIPTRDLALGQQHYDRMGEAHERICDRIRELCTSSESNYEVFANEILEALSDGT